MKYRTAVRILTLTSAFLCGSSGTWAVWFWRQGAILPAALDLFSALITLAGTIYGVWWLTPGWRN